VSHHKHSIERFFFLPIWFFSSLSHAVSSFVGASDVSRLERYRTDVLLARLTKGTRLLTGLIASCDPVWLQESFNVLIGLFERIGLFTNAAKTKAMVCIPGRIQEGYTEEEYANYKSPIETSVNRKRCHVDCEICGASLAAGSYQSHLESQHDVFCSMVLQRDIVVDRPPVVYLAIKLLGAGTYFCLVPHCIGKASTK
jgi:hypothetical protein